MNTRLPKFAQRNQEIEVNRIVIIAILAGMLLPALQQARAKARAINCTSNMKQLGTGFHMYADANRDFVPSVTAEKVGDISFYWPSRLIGGKYAAGSSFICPEAITFYDMSRAWIATVVSLWKKGADDPDVVAGSREKGAYPYAYSSYGLSDGFRDQALDPNNLSRKITHYRKPSRKMMCGEARNKDNYNVGRYVGSYYAGYNLTRAGFLSAVHNSRKSINILWVDGHVSNVQLAVPADPYQTITTDFIWYKK